MHHFRNLRPWLIFPMVIGGLAFAVLIAFLFGYFVMILWNWLMPVIFGLTVINYWQAWGLLLLSQILFKLNPVPRHGHYGRHHFNKDEFHEKMKERFDCKKED